MNCPKCGYVGSGDSCPKCGLVFSKWNAPRRPRPVPMRRRATPERNGSSWLNVLALSVIFIVAAGVGWRLLKPPMGVSEPPPAGATSESSPGWSGPAAPFDPPGTARAERDGPEESARPRAGEKLVLRGLSPDAADETAASPPVSEPEEIEIPKVDPNNVSPEFVRQIVEMARRYPDNEPVRRAAARAYLALAYRRYSEGQYRVALDAAGEAQSWNASPRDVARVSARACLELEDLARAMEWAQAALAFGPDADMYYVLGRVYYLREEMDKAIEAFETALSVREDPQIRAALDKALREKRVAESFDRQRLSHFIVRYEGDTMEETGRMVLGSLERSYSFLKSTLGFEPAEPVVVILYARRDYMELGGPRWSAGLFDGKVRVPIMGLTELDQHVANTLQHELTHAFIHARAGKNCPRWLHEGLAEYCEGSRSERYGKILAQKIDEEGDFSYCLLGERCDVRFYYPAATSVVEYILQSRGMGGIRDLLARLGDGAGIDTALRDVTGRDEIGLIRDWQRFVRRRYL